ncbi:MAG: hypothetical protein AAGE96_16715 [Cyanobacteria bacterium P01_G01_bin.19]
MSKFLVRQTIRVAYLLAIALALFIAVSLLMVAPESTPQQSDSIKGIWFGHVGNAFLTYTNLTDNIFHQLSGLNYNRVYVDVYNNGTSYSSKYAPRNYIVALPSPILMVFSLTIIGAFQFNLAIRRLQ